MKTIVFERIPRSLELSNNSKNDLKFIPLLKYVRCSQILKFSTASKQLFT